MGKPKLSFTTPTCNACGVHWRQHLGAQPLCHRLQVARDALRIIGTLAEQHKLANIARLCKQKLEESQP